MENKLIQRSLVLALLGLVCVCPVSGDELVPDENLRAVVLELKKQRQKPGDEITQEDLRGIYFLNAVGREIKSLAGLEHCINLGELRLADNDITDVSPLGQLKNLQSLDLSNNQVADPSPLGNIAALQYLKLDGNQIEKLDGLGQLKSLNVLYLSRNKISDIRPLKELGKLWTLHLDHNQLEDISPLSELQVESLNLSHNRIHDVTPLMAQRRLTFTFLHGNQIEDIGPLVEMARADAENEKRFALFWKLYLANNPLNEGSRQKLDELREMGVRLNMEYDK